MQCLSIYPISSNLVLFYCIFILINIFPSFLPTIFFILTKPFGVVVLSIGFVKKGLNKVLGQYFFCVVLIESKIVHSKEYFSSTSAPSHSANLIITHHAKLKKCSYVFLGRNIIENIDTSSFQNVLISTYNQCETEAYIIYFP